MWKGLKVADRNLHLDWMWFVKERDDFFSSKVEKCTLITKMVGLWVEWIWRGGGKSGRSG